MTDVVTGEAVVLDVRVARLPSRIVALFLDVLVQGAMLGAITWLMGRIGAVADTALTSAISLVLVVGVVVGYPTTLESLWRGRSVGKAALGLRVVGEDGGPERFRQALFRALTGFVEIWLTVGSAALITSLVSRQGRRLGDIFAGTLVIRERLPARGGAVAAMPPPLASWASGLELSGLTNEAALTARQFISRYHELAPDVRDDMAQRIASSVAELVSPPPPAGTPPMPYLSAVLAERRRREEARLGVQQAPPQGFGAGVYGNGIPYAYGPAAAGQAAPPYSQGPHGGPVPAQPYGYPPQGPPYGNGYHAQPPVPYGYPQPEQAPGGTPTQPHHPHGYPSGPPPGHGEPAPGGEPQPPQQQQQQQPQAPERPPDNGFAPPA